MSKSRYTLAHALAASLVVVAIQFLNGPAAFWHQFIHGVRMTMTPAVLVQVLLMTFALFGGMFLLLWASVAFLPRRDGEAPAPVTGAQRRAGVQFAVLAAVPATVVALGLAWFGMHAVEWILHVKPAEQDLVRCFVSGSYPTGVQVLLVASVLVQAPLVEEALFRGVVFRGFASRLSVRAALLLSGAVFAFAHANAGSFIALWFLGAFFAWLYRRTGTILAPMAAHALFNATNLVLLMLFPELGAN